MTIDRIDRNDPRHRAAVHRLHKALAESGDNRLASISYDDVMGFGASSEDFVWVMTYCGQFKEMIRESDADHHEPRCDE